MTLEHGTPIAGDENEDAAALAAAVLEKHHISTETAAGLKAKHGEAWVLDDFPVIVRKPKRQYFNMFVDKMRKEKGNAEAMTEFARHCIVWPADASSVTALFEDSPGLVTLVTGECVGLARKEPIDAGKKL